MVITSLSWKERKNERNIMGNGYLHETSISETDYFVLNLEIAAWLAEFSRILFVFIYFIEVDVISSLVF